jgi:PAS domain S-box-containing protein
MAGGERVPGPYSSSEYQALYECLFEHGPDAILLGRPDGTMLRANPAACRLFGGTEKDLIRAGRGLVVDTPSFQEMLARRAGAGLVHGLLLHRRLDGSTFLAEVTSTTVPAPGEAACAFTIVREVSEREQARRGLEGSEARLREVLDASSDGFWERDAAAGTIFLSARMNEILGLPPVDRIATDREFFGRIHPDDRAEPGQVHEALMARRIDRFTSDYRIRHEDGAWRWVRSRGKVAARDAAGTPLRIIGTITDIDAQKASEEALQAREAKLRAYLESPAVGVVLTEGGGQIAEVSDHFCGMLGYTREELAGRSWRDLTHPEDVEADLAFVRRLAAGQIQAFAREKRYLRKDGGLVCALTSVSSSRAPDGSLRWTIAIVQDISERKRAEEVVASSERRYRQLYEGLPDGFVRVAMDGTILEMNEAFCRMVGHTPDELRRMRYQDLTPERWHAFEARILAEQLRSKGHVDPYEKEYRRKDGSVFPVDLRVFLAREDGQQLTAWAVVRDITNRKRAEDELRASEARLRRVMEGSSDGYYEIDAATRQVRFSPRYAEIHGLPEGTTELPLDDLAGRNLPTDLEWMRRDMDALRDGPMDRFRWEHQMRLPDGSTRWVESRGKVVERGADGRALRISGTVSDIQKRKRAEEALRESEARFRALADDAPVGIFQADARGSNTYLNEAGAWMLGLERGGAIGNAWEKNLHPDDDRVRREWYAASGSGAPFLTECRFRRPDGTTTLVRAQARALRDAGGQTAGHMGVLLDVTEERALATNLAVSSRLAALGTLVAGVAHEINNPLAGSLASQELAIEDVRGMRDALRSGDAADREALVRQLDEVLEAIVDARAGGQRIARVVRDLGAFGKPDPRKVPVRLGDVAEESLRWLAASVSGTATVRLDVKDVPAVMASSGQLQQVVINLVTNAAKSIPAGRKGVVTLRVGPAGPGKACLEVEDNGEGISSEVMQRMFDPFFTTSEVGKGMGLGLPVCHAIVTAHGGTIAATSKPGVGSTFRVELPLAPEDAPAPGAGRASS